jgi:hypothetical protein
MLPMPAILRGSAASLAVASAEPDRPPDSAELARLEVDVLERLDRLGALVSDEIDLSRPAPHTLRLAASFADPARAGELTGVLGSVLARPGLELRITVVDPAASAGATAAGAGISPLRALEVEPNASAASATLREYVAARAPAQDVDGEVTRISQRFYRRARTVLRHARALASVADRFDPAALRALDAEAYLGWRSLIERHAAGAAHETEALRLELDPILFPDRAFEAPLDTAAAHLPLNDAVRALLDAAALQDDAIGAAFAASAVPRPEVDLEGLRRLARRIEVASAAIPGAVER